MKKLMILLISALFINTLSAQTSYKNYMPTKKNNVRVQKKFYYENSKKPYKCDVFFYDKKGRLDYINTVTEVNGELKVTATKNIGYSNKGLTSTVNLKNDKGNEKITKYFFDTKNKRIKLKVELKSITKNYQQQERFYYRYQDDTFTGYLIKDDRGKELGQLEIKYDNGRISETIFTDRGFIQKHVFEKENDILIRIKDLRQKEGEYKQSGILDLEYKDNRLFKITDHMDNGEGRRIFIQSYQYEYDADGNLIKKYKQDDSGNFMYEYVYEEGFGNAILFEYKVPDYLNFIPLDIIPKIK